MANENGCPVCEAHPERLVALQVKAMLRASRRCLEDVVISSNRGDPKERVAEAGFELALVLETTTRIAKELAEMLHGQEIEEEGALPAGLMPANETEESTMATKKGKGKGGGGKKC